MSKRGILLLSLWLFVLPSFAFAAKHTFVCSDWDLANATGASCSSGVVTLSSATGNISDGPRNGTPNSGFTLSAGTTYYYVLDSVSGSGTGGLYILNSGHQAGPNAFTYGGGTQQTSLVAPTVASANQTLFDWPNGTTATVDYMCVSDVSYADCAAPVPPSTGGDTASSTIDQAEQNMYDGFGLFLGFFFVTMWVFRTRR